MDVSSRESGQGGQGRLLEAGEAGNAEGIRRREMDENPWQRSGGQLARSLCCRRFPTGQKQTGWPKLRVSCPPPAPACPPCPSSFPARASLPSFGDNDREILSQPRWSVESPGGSGPSSGYLVHLKSCVVVRGSQA